MNPDKKYILEELLERVNGSPFLIVIDYNGLTVTQFKELRNRLALNNGTEVHVAKNTFIKRVLVEAGLPEISDELKGQTAFVTGDADVCAVSKTVASFIKEVKKAAIKGGILDGKAITAEQFGTLAALPSRDALLAQLLRVINEPGASIARVIQAKFNPDADSSEAETSEEEAPEAAEAVAE